MTKTLFAAAAVLACAGALAASPAAARPAKCDITSADVGRYVGPCDFKAGKGGSFELTLPESADELVYTRYLVVTITGPGRGNLSGAGGTGRVSSWGPVRRDPRKPACWAGEWGRVCVY